MQPTPDDLARRAAAFRELHAGPGAFVMANAWDAGSARILTGLGFRALGTTSAGLAFSLARPDGACALTLDEVLANAAAIVAATDLPVSADLEHCYADDLEGVATTIRLAGEVGLAGGSIEDTMGPESPILPLPEAARRVAAAVAAAAKLPVPFTITARAENFQHGRPDPDLDDTIARLRTYQDEGADVLFAPRLPDLDAVSAVCAAVTAPVNVIAGPQFTVTQLAQAGVRRISLGSGLARVALAAAIAAARETGEQGTFGYLADALPYPAANELMSAGEARS
jgi:2-methylisocitrate lyase-like PEP mutase family enzyme